MAFKEYTNAELLQALAAVREYGNKADAARALGVDRSNIRRRYQRAIERGLDLHLDSASTQIVDDKSKAAHAELQALRGELRAAREQNTRLEKERDEAVSQLDAARNVKGISFPSVSTSKTKVRCRLIFPDFHGNHHDPDAVGAMLTDIDAVAPDEAIGLGDLLECGGWLAQQHTLGYVAEVNQMSYESDVAAANEFLNKLQAKIPKVELLEGNHESRIEKWLVTATLRHGGDAEYLRRMIGPEAVLGLEKRGIPYHKFHEHHDGLPVPGVIKRGELHLTHGFSTAKHAAWQHVLATGAPVAYGHTHRADYSVNRTVAHGMAAAWCPGTLSRLQPLWQHNTPTNWTHGYLLQFIAPDDRFQMIHVPIENGRSYLASVMGTLAK